MSAAPTRPSAQAGAYRVPWQVIIRRNWQTWFNVYLFALFSYWVAHYTRRVWLERRFDHVEISFAAQNVIFVLLVLVRRQHQSIDRNPWNQLVAIVAFCSGMLFMGQPGSGGPAAAGISKVITFAANVLGILCLLNLGRSFGILIALREVKTRGLYGIVRHPMYATDVILRAGFLVSHWTWLTASLFVLSTACYVYRALLEERFLSRVPDYREYMSRVRYRFLPGVF